MKNEPASRGPADARHWLRWVVLALALAFALGSADFYKLEIEQKARAEFHAMAIDTSSQIDLRIRAYADVLYALRGLFDASEKVTRDDFHEFARALSIGERYPGLTNLSFALLVPHERKQAFEQAVRAETGALVKGLPKFSIKPPGERPEYVVLNYLEPIEKNLLAWGLDLMADPQRRSVIERARDNGGISSGSGITLLRDGNTPITSSLLRLAVYRGGGVPESVSERQRLFIGVVGSTQRIAELVEATLKKEALGRMRVRIFANGAAVAGGDAAPAEQLLYDSRPAGAAAPAADYPEYAVNQQIALGDRSWRVMITPLQNPFGFIDKAMLAGWLAVMLAIAALSFWLLSALSTIQQRALELARRRREVEQMLSLGDDLHSSIRTRDACEVLARHMPGLLPDTAGVLYVTDASHSGATAAARWGSPGAVAEEFASHDCWSIRRGDIRRAETAAEAQNCSHFTADPPHVYVCMPLNAQGELIGMLHVQRSPDVDSAPAFSEAEMNLIRAVVQSLSLALANLALRENLIERATRDILTKLYNRRYMLEWFEQELHRARRYRRSIGVIMLDIDYFKRVNDDFGHAAGDMVLVEVAGVIQRLARKSDVACRQGGEEFLLLMPEATPEGTLGKAEELRQEVARLSLSFEGRVLRGITISAGVAMYPVHAATVDTLLRCADEALYAAKAEGRNRVVVSGARAASPDPQKA